MFLRLSPWTGPARQGPHRFGTALLRAIGRPEGLPPLSPASCRHSASVRL